MSKNKNYSVWKCAFCEPLEESDKGYINPPTCPYTHVEINGKVYKRDQGSIFDQHHTIDDDEVVTLICRDRGVKYGNTHHVVCSKESCPVGESDGELCVQFLGCGHDEDTWYMKSPDSREYFPGLIKRLTMREHEDEGLGE